MTKKAHFPCTQRMIMTSYQYHLLGGWATYPNLKNDGLEVSWENEYSQYDGKNIRLMFQTTNQV